MKKYFPKLLLFISLSLFCYIFYKSEFFWSGNKRDYYFYYYLFSLFLIFLSLLFVFNLIILNNYILIISASIILSVYLTEIYFNFFHPNLTKNYKITKFNEIGEGKFDLRSKAQVYNNLKTQNYTITLPPSNFLNDKLVNESDIFPLSGISNKKTLFCNENGYFAEYFSDKYGFNNPREEWKKENQILLIGDSFVHGACVQEGKDIASNLRKFTENGVLNLGYSGNSTLIQLATIKEYFNENSSKVILFFFENDIEELSYEMKNKTLIKYFNDKNFSQNLKNKQFLIDNKNKQKIKLNFKKEKNNIYNLIKLEKVRSIINSFLFKDRINLKMIKQFELILKELQEFIITNKAQLYVVYLDGYYENKALKRKIKNIANEINLKFIDFKEEINNKDLNFVEIFPFKLPGHYNENGYKILSEIINEKINLN